ncbi:MAG: response regulator transcription factor [Oscillospiraceae bacterium]|nr:response regulator transcription factor [Oscillospiraceae bacterium]
MSRILIVEDDSEINKLLADFLQKNNYETISAEDGGKASLLLRKQDFDLVLMDLMLPYKSGEHLIKEFREYSQIPVIVLSAKSVMETRLEVLRLGADDYILKPFDLNEVLVRIEVVLRRSGAASSSAGETFSCGDLCFNVNENSVTYQGKAVALTAKELMLLKLFMEYPQKVYTKANLYESVWNDTYYYEDNTINVHVSNLRSKLKKATGNDYIETVWGIGYRLKGE